MTNILVADDELDLREVVALALRSAGHDVTETSSGLEAVALAAQRRFDLVLLDVDLAELQGVMVAEVIRDLGPVPIVATSGRNDEWQRCMLASGATACLPKPFEIVEMLSLVRSILRTRERREGGWPTDVRSLSQDELSRVEHLPTDDLDALPFGAIALDREGRILAYNAYESEMSTRGRAEVIGRRFSEIAPCTAVQKLARRLESAMRGDSIDSVVRFVFPHGRGCALVSIRVHRDPDEDRAWVFVSKRVGPVRAAAVAELEGWDLFPR